MSARHYIHGSALICSIAALCVATIGDAKWHPHAKHTIAKRPNVMVHTAAYRGINTTVEPRGDVSLSIGSGQLIRLAEPISDVFTSNDSAVDIHVQSTTELYLFAKARGTSSVYATNRAGQIIYSANVHAEQNLNSIDEMLHIALPEDQVTATKISGMIILTGTVLNPEDAQQAVMLVNGYVGNDPDAKVKKLLVINRIKTATPQQVNLRVRIAEVSRSVSKQIGSNLQNLTTSGSTAFAISNGRAGAVTIAPGSVANYPTKIFTPGGTAQPYDPNTGLPLPFNTATGQYSAGTNYTFSGVAGQTLLGIGGRFLGMDVGAALDLAETDGLVTTLAQPNLTALSGETASFLAGGEIPIPIASSSGTGTTVSVEYKSYGVSLSFTPIVLADGRISMRVRPEVSELTSDGAVTISGLSIPALKVRRSETTVELGSGQSMVISGLLQNNDNNTTTKTPGLGDVPIIGALLRSNTYQKGESELMIVVTPYLVKPVNDSQIALPTDGYKAPTDLQRVLLGKNNGGTSDGTRHNPTMATPETKATPAVGALDALPPVAAAPRQVPAPTPAQPEQVGLAAPVATAPQPNQANKPKSRSANDAAPGFGS